MYVFVTYGQPGSGKTFTSTRLAKDLNLTHLNSDRVRLRLFRNPEYTVAENQIVFTAMDLIAESLLGSRTSIIYDGNLTKKEFRTRVYKLARKYHAKPFLLWFDTPIQSSITRVAKRSTLKSKKLREIHRPIDEEVIHRLKANMQDPTNEPVIKLDGLATYKKQKDVILRAIKSAVK